MRSHKFVASIACIPFAVLVVLLIAAGGDAAGQAAQASGGAEAATLAQEWAAALQAGKVERMKPLLADDYIYINAQGKAIDGETMMRLLKDRVIRIQIQPADRRLHLHKGGTLIMTGTCRVAGEMDGRKLDGDYRYLDVFERQGERWVAIASSVTPIEEGSAAAAKPSAAGKGAAE